MNNYVTKVASIELATSCETYEDVSQVRIGEDLLQSLPLVTKAEKIVYIGKPLYYYRKNNASMTATSGINRYDSERVVFRELIRYASLWGIISSVYRDILKRYASMCIDTLITSVRKGNNDESFFNTVSRDELFIASQTVFAEFPLWKRLLGRYIVKGKQKRFILVQCLVLQLSQIKKFIWRKHICLSSASLFLSIMLKSI